MNGFVKMLRHAVLTRPSVAFNQRKHDAFQRLIERVLSPDGYIFRKWHNRRERKLDYKKARGEILNYVLGNPNTKDIVIYIPGTFDTDNEERLNKLYEREYPDREVGLRETAWIAPNFLYSKHDYPRIFALWDHVHDLAEKHLKDGAHVRLVGYSMGGILAELVGHELDEKYGAQLAVIPHNSPRDPMSGFFVRWANMKKVYKRLGYDPGKPHKFYLDPATGEHDAIVPPVGHFQGRDGRLIASKVLRGSRHRDPLGSVEAMDDLLKRLRKAKEKISKAVEELDRDKLAK